MAERQRITASFLAELAGVDESTVRENVRLLRLLVGETLPKVSGAQGKSQAQGARRQS